MKSSESVGEVIWFVSVGGDKVRALNVDELDAAYKSGAIDEDPLVRRDGELTWSTLGAVAGIEPREVEDDVDMEVVAVTSQPPRLPPPLPSRAARPRSFRDRLPKWSARYAAAGVAAGLLSFVAFLAATHVARSGAPPQVAASAAIAPAVNAHAPLPIAPAKSVVPPFHPAATKAAPLAVHPAAAKPVPAVAKAATTKPKAPAKPATLAKKAATAKR